MKFTNDFEKKEFLGREAIKELQKSYEYQPYDGIMTDRFLKKINE